jgi:Cu/Ag efflux protein CusF
MLMNKFVLALVLAIICIGTGCQSAPEKRYAIQAEVISAEPQRQMITVKHGEIPGLMPAMTMSYLVAEPKQIESLKPGDKISADLVVSDSKGRLEKIALISIQEVKPPPAN